MRYWKPVRFVGRIARTFKRKFMLPAVPAETQVLVVSPGVPANNLKELIARINTIRREHPALQRNSTLRFLPADNTDLLWFSKSWGRDVVFVAANTTPASMQHGWVELPIDALGIPPGASYVVEDLLDGTTYTWHGAWNYVRLVPADPVRRAPAH